MLCLSELCWWSCWYVNSSYIAYSQSKKGQLRFEMIIFIAIFTFLCWFSKLSDTYFISFIVLETVIFMLFFQIWHFLANIIENMRSHLFHSKILSLLRLRSGTGLQIILVELSRRWWYNRMSLVCSFLFLISIFLKTWPEDDTLAHKLYDGHKLEENLHYAYSKFWDFHKLAWIFYF